MLTFLPSSKHLLTINHWYLAVYLQLTWPDKPVMEPLLLVLSKTWVILDKHTTDYWLSIRITRKSRLFSKENHTLLCIWVPRTEINIASSWRGRLINLVTKVNNPWFLLQWWEECLLCLWECLLTGWILSRVVFQWCLTCQTHPICLICQTCLITSSSQQMK